MKKVKLLLEALRVESFAVEPDSRGTGTVRGLELEGSGVHSQCYTHCPSQCGDPCITWLPSECGIECPSWDGRCEGTPIDG